MSNGVRLRGLWRPTDVQPRPLLWSPPTLSSPVDLFVTDDKATRRVSYSGSQDVRIHLPSTPISFTDDISNNDAILHIIGGRNIVLIGGHISVVAPAPTTMTGAVDAVATSLPVASTTGFPQSGTLRVDGEAINYTSKTATSFDGCTRNAGYYDTVISSKTHAVGATVYLGESCRSGIRFAFQNGTVHVEGLKIDGDVNDGIRIHANDTTRVQIQNTTIGPTINFENTYATDGHPDCLQILRGPAELRMDRCTLRTASGRTILNQGAANGRAMTTASLRDVLLAGTSQYTAALISNDDVATSWHPNNVLAQPFKTTYATTTDTGLADRLTRREITDAVPDFAAVGQPGIGYVSPGYLN